MAEYGLPPIFVQPSAIAMMNAFDGTVIMNSILLRLWKEDKGQDLTEYGLLLTLVALSAISVMKGLAKGISAMFSNASTSLS